MAADPVSSQQIPAGFADLLDRPLLAHLATVRPDGTPQISPMWFTWDGRHLLFSSTRTRRKHASILARPQVAVSIADPEAFRHIELRGVITGIEADEGCAVWMELSRRYGDPGAGMPPDAADRVVYRFEPGHVTTFARRPDWAPVR